MPGNDRRDMVPVSLSGGVEPGARTGTSAGGQPIVLWRGQDGAVHARADRCPHRGMRLSFGFVRDNKLTCIYHGWSFGSLPGEAGLARCLTVPAHPGVAPPVKATVAVLPVAEALGVIWVGVVPGASVAPAGAARADATFYPVRSVTALAPAQELRTAVEVTPPQGAENVETSADGLIVTFRGPALVLAMIQDRGDGASTAHLVTTESGAAYRKALCQWAALVRDHLAAVVVP